MKTYLFLIGCFLGYTSWIVGVVFLLHALRASIRCVLYRRQWVSTMNYIGRNAITCPTKGRILQTMQRIHPITKDVSYDVTYEYEIDYNHYDSGENKNKKIVQKKVSSFVEARWMYDKYHHQHIRNKEHDASSDIQTNKAIPKNQLLQIKILSGRPYSGIPSDILYNKLTECKIWSTYVDPVIAFIGFHIYVIGCWTYSWYYTLSIATNDDSDNLIFWMMLMFSLVVAPILMIPYLLQEQFMVHHTRINQIRTDPTLLQSEFDTIRLLWNSIGTTWIKKCHAIMFLLGLMEVIWMTQLVSIAAIVAVWSWTLLVGDVPSKREHLERYGSPTKSSTVHGKVILGRCITTTPPPLPKPKLFGSYKVTIRYEMTKNIPRIEEAEFVDGGAGEEACTRITVEKQYLVSKESYQLYTKTTKEKTTTTIPIRVLNEYPCSGIPMDKLVKDTVKSWTMTFVHRLFWFAFMTYFGGCYMIVLGMNEFDLYWDIFDFIWYAMLLLLGPILMMPQLSTWHRTRYQKLVDETIFKGKIINNQ